MKIPLKTFLAAVGVASLISPPIPSATAQTASVPVPWSDPQTITNVNGATVVLTGDFNDDDLMDIFVCEGGQGQSAADNAPVLSWFEAPNWVEHPLSADALTPFAGSAQVADFNGDGLPDIAVAEDFWGNSSSVPGNLFVYINPGASAVSGYWPRHQIYSLPNVYHQNDMAVADMDGDLLLDIVVRHRNNANRTIVALQNSINDWTVVTLPETPAQALAEGLSVGDIDTSNQAGVKEIVLSGDYLRATGDWRNGSFNTFRWDSDGLFYGEEVKTRVLDIDGDSLLDIFCTSAEKTAKGIAWFRNDGTPANGPWAQTLLRANFGKCHMLDVGDIDGNGHDDIITGRAFLANGVWVYYNDGVGNLTEQRVTNLSGYYWGALGDVDGDGDLDVVGAEDYSKTYPIKLIINEGTIAPPPPPSGSDLDVQIQAEDHDADGPGTNAVPTYPTGPNPTKIGNIQNGEWVSFYDFNFESGFSALDVRLASKRQGGTVEFRLGSANGLKIATASIGSTGGWDNFETVQATVDNPATGVHDLFLVFTGGSGSLLDVDWFEFSSGTPPSGPAAIYSTNFDSGNPFTNVSAVSLGGNPIGQISIPSSGNVTAKDNFGGASNAIALAGETQLNVSAKLQLAANVVGDVRVRMVIRFLDANDNAIDVNGDYLSVDNSFVGSFQPYAESMVVPANATRIGDVRIRVNQDASGSASQTIYVDDVLIEEP